MQRFLTESCVDEEENIWRKAAAFMSHNDRASVAEVKAGNGLEISQNTSQRLLVSQKK